MAIFKIDSFLNWFYVAIGVWVLIWSKYMSFTQIAMVYSISLFWGLILELPSGALADMVGRKKTVILGRFLSVLSYTILIFANKFELFLIGHMLYQTNWSLESGALSALLYDSLKENGKEKELYKKTETDTFFYCTVGMAVASILGGILYRYNQHWPYVASAIVVGIGLLFSLFYEEPDVDSEKFSLSNYIKQNVDVIKHIFRHKLIRSVSLFSILIDFVAYAGLWYLYEPRLAEGGFRAEWMGILVAGTYLARAWGTKIISWIDQRFRQERVPIVITLVQTLGSLLSFLPGGMGAIGSVYVRKFSDGIRRPILTTIQNENIDSKHRATSLSALSLLSNLLIAGVGPVIGWMNDKTNISSTLGMFGVLGMIIVLPAAVHLGGVIKKNESVELNLDAGA